DARHAAVELLPLVNDVFRKLVAARVGTVASLRTWSATGGGSSVRERPAARLSPVHGSGVTTSTAVTGLSGAAGGSSGQSQSAPSSLSRARRGRGAPVHRCSAGGAGPARLGRAPSGGQAAADRGAGSARRG